MGLFEKVYYCKLRQINLYICHFISKHIENQSFYRGYSDYIKVHYLRGDYAEKEIIRITKVSKEWRITMKRRFLILLTALLLAALFSGCGNSVKTEKELKTDLTAHSGFYMVEGSEVSELSIIKRLTDVDNRTDKVYVSILIDHPNATESRAYVMNYTLYNDGWMLDDVKDYYGDESIWEVKPKGAPTNEQVMAELIKYSNAQIDASYTEQYLSDKLPHTYFFEEGKYASKIYTGEFVSETQYTCVAETERVFNYARVFEIETLYFLFDDFSYTWELYDANIIFDGGTWDFRGEWYSPLHDLTLNVTKFYDSFDFDKNIQTKGFECRIASDGEYLLFYPTLYYPTSNMIYINHAFLEDGTGIFKNSICHLMIAPDIIICDTYRNDFCELDPIGLCESIPPLDRTGIIDMNTKQQ